MKLWFSILLPFGLTVASLGLCLSIVNAQDAVVSASIHPWGRFAPGAWKLVHVDTETLDAQGKLISTTATETKSSLVRIEHDCVVLQVEVGVKIAGRQLEGNPQAIKQGFHGELYGPQVEYKPVKPAEVLLEGQRRECSLQEIDFTSPTSRTVSHLYVSNNVWPHVLKRDSTTTDATGTVLSETTSQVLVHDVPEKVLTDMKSVAYVQTVQKSPKGSITTISMTTPDVPGGVFQQTTKELDSAGQLVRRSSLKLVSYGTKPDDERGGLFGRMRRRKANK